MEKLLAILQVKAAVLRDGSPKEIPVEEIVPGDIEHGIRLFGYFFMEVTLVLVVAIFAINDYLARPVLSLRGLCS